MAREESACVFNMLYHTEAGDKLALHKVCMHTARCQTRSAQQANCSSQYLAGEDVDEKSWHCHSKTRKSTCLPVYTRACSTDTLASGSSLIPRQVGLTHVSFTPLPLIDMLPLTAADPLSLPPIKFTKALLPEPKGPTMARMDLQAESAQHGSSSLQMMITSSQAYWVCTTNVGSI